MGDRKLSITQRLWVIGTIALISFLVYTPQIFIVWPWYDRRWSADFLKVVAPLNFCGVMIFWNYYLCVTTDPGHVPSGWRPDPATQQAFEVKKLTHGPRYCKTCHEYKPPRSHHCRQCKQCVLKMDHHCPWIANCVGFRNQGHFLRFLVWVDFGMAVHMLIILARMRAFTTWSSPEPTTADVIWMVTNLAAGVPVGLCIGIFSLYHLYCAAGNSTTIEGWEKDRVATLVRRGKIKEIKYPYNLGIYRNMQAVLGRNLLLWLWPQRMVGEGLSFPVSEAVTATIMPFTVAWWESIQYQLGRAMIPQSSITTPPLRVWCDLDGREKYVLQQYSWPPRDPDRDRPIRPLPNPLDNPFTYGTSFNPALSPSNANIRSRIQSTPRPDTMNQDMPEPIGEHEQISEDIYSSGEERDDSNGRSSNGRSSPERYLSDMDDSEDEPCLREEGHDRRVRVRRGSEGYEVAAVTSWNSLRELDEAHGVGPQAGYQSDTASDAAGDAADTRVDSVRDPLITH